MLTDETLALLQELSRKPRPVDKSMDEEQIERIYWERFVYMELPWLIATCEIGNEPEDFFTMVREEWESWRADKYDDARNSGPGFKGELFC